MKGEKENVQQNKQQFSFIHTADLHLDSPFLGISDVDSELGECLSKSTFQTYDSIIEQCIERKVDFLLIAGDVYDSADKSLYAQIKFLDGLRRLSDYGVSVYICHGNHDPLNGWSARLKWPDNVHVMRGDTVDCIDFKKDDEIVARILGISYPIQHIESNLVKKFPVKMAEWPFTIGLLHCTVGSSDGHYPYSPCTVEDLRCSNYDYWALGHIHAPSQISTSDPVIIYSGTPQGRHPGECGAHGCFYVSVDSKERVSVEFVETDSIRWYVQEISIDEINTEGELLERMQDTIDEIREKVDGRSVICRFVLKGRSPLHTSLKEEDILSNFLQVLRDTEFSNSSFIWVDRIEDYTRLPVDRETLLKRKDFVGDVVNIVESLSENDNTFKDLRRTFENLFKSSIGKNLLSNIDKEELPDIIQRAENILLDYLLTEEKHAD